jgi:hypothetical protein
MKKGTSVGDVILDPFFKSSLSGIFVDAAKIDFKQCTLGNLLFFEIRTSSKKCSKVGVYMMREVHRTGI